ncbi:uncharacterized protein RSE6_01297 [Rhynchosporium secalis]|uniref:Uncharacterized protein n=1 Tax=Rhynchosporium secalis TaxID=38038 RepID=A0A1E1LXF2_RHYSE|nr:uncharacterized protein RSE6_01297 [Rhynchosporium secalis]
MRAQHIDYFTGEHKSPAYLKINDTTKQAPVMLAHCDYTAESGPIRVRQLLWDEAGDLLSRRVACFNTDDLFNLHLRYCDHNGENYVMRYSPTHQCWYFPKMEADQVILLKTYESRSDVARFIGHTAFENPMSPPDAKIHESVEIRTIAFL